MTEYCLQTPLQEQELLLLRAGDKVYLSGVVYTARDAAHKRLCDAITHGEQIPFEIKGQTVFYAGPAPAQPGAVIGSVGPTTSYRMDMYTPLLLSRGLKAMIGKGRRNEIVREAIIQHKAVYFAAVGGAAALISQCVKNCAVVAYADLATEAIRRLEIESLPLWVAIDSCGNELYK